MFFVDTNILVYLHDSKEPEKQDRATRILEHLWQSGSGRLSFQVLLEFYAVATRKLSPGLSPSIATREIQDLLDWNPLAPSASILDEAWRIQDRHGLSWWDSLIVAAAIAQDCTTLLTEDLQHGLIIGNLRVANPFHSDFQLEALSAKNRGKPSA